MTCYHQVIFKLSQEERWRALDRNTRLQQLTAALEQVTPMVAAQKRRHTRETLHRGGQRIAAHVEAQLGPLLVDLSKGEEDSTMLQQLSGRKRKEVERPMYTSSDVRDSPDKKSNIEVQEEELRQGRRVYAIVGSSHAGYSLQCKVNTARSGPLKIYETEDEIALEPEVLTEETQRARDAMEGTEEDWWEILTDYMKDTDTEHSQGTSEAPNLSQLHDGQVQANSLEATGDATERSPAGTTEGQSADTQASDTDQTGAGTQLHEAGQEESKDEPQLPRIGVKRRRSRRTQIEDLLAGAALPVGKRIRTAVDYTPSLDKEDTKVAAKEIRTLPGLRHQRWPVGYARSTINKVLAPGQDAGFGLFATSPIECNAIRRGSS